MLQDGAGVCDGDHDSGGDSSSDKGDIQLITPVFAPYQNSVPAGCSKYHTFFYVTVTHIKLMSDSQQMVTHSCTMLQSAWVLALLSVYCFVQLSQKSSHWLQTH